MMRAMADGTLRIAADANNQAEIRHFVRETAAAWGAGADTVCSLELAVDEAACNIITHGYGGQPGLIEVQVERDGKELLIRLRDWAPPFDPTRVPDPDLTLPVEERPPGGMGIYFIRQSVDQMLYRAMPDGGNELTLVKRLDKEQDNGHCHS